MFIEPSCYFIIFNEIFWSSNCFYKGVVRSAGSKIDMKFLHNIFKASYLLYIIMKIQLYQHVEHKICTSLHLYNVDIFEKKIDYNFFVPFDMTVEGDRSRT